MIGKNGTLFQTREGLKEQLRLVMGHFDGSKIICSWLTQYIRLDSEYYT